jgi:segregation and condensation protein B
LLGTTAEFLDYFSLKSIEDLPPLAELKSLTDLNLQLPLPVNATGENGEAHAPDSDANTDSGEVATVPVLEASAEDSSDHGLDAASDEDSDDEELSAPGDAAAGLVAAPPSDEN